MAVVKPSSVSARPAIEVSRGAPLRKRIVRATRSAIRIFRDELLHKYHWHGIHTCFADVGAAGAGFSDDAWVKGARRAAELAMEENRAGFVPRAVQGDDALLPLLCSVLAQSSRRLRILDFGGGAGASYAMLSGAIVSSCSIEYTIVEVPNVAHEGAAVFADNPAVRFCSEVPTDQAVDIVFVSTALQYVDDWRLLLRKLAALQPRCWLFTKLSTGDVPTYIAAQLNVEGFRIPYRFINIDELLTSINETGYRLCFKCASTVLLNQDNYPQTHRLEGACNLLFVRKENQ